MPWERNGLGEIREEANRLPIESLRAELPAIRDRVYLNTGTSGPMPERSLKAACDLLEWIAREGFASPPVLSAYSRTLAEAREKLASVLSCDPGSIALTHSTSDGIGIVAAGIDWQAGDEVIISDLEHISGIAPWMLLAKRKGIVVRNLQSEGGRLAAERIVQAITPKTKLICVSHVSYATGAVLPVQEICRTARRAGAWVVVDGAQAVGHLPVDVTALECDFYALPGQKWLLGPEGTGALYVAPQALEAIEPARIGWASLAHDPGQAGEEEIRLHPDARRFETGTIHAPAFRALTESIRMLEAIGWNAIFQRALHLADLAREQLAQIPGVRIVTPKAEASGLLTFAIDGIDPERVVKEVWSNHRIVIRSIPSFAALRAAFHAFNDQDDVEALTSAIAAVAKSA